jgi:hypothetical protein
VYSEAPANWLGCGVSVFGSTYLLALLWCKCIREHLLTGLVVVEVYSEAHSLWIAGGLSVFGSTCLLAW